MTPLVLYDSRGQCQAVALTDNPTPFLQAGFVEVELAEYQRCALLVDRATESDLTRISTARQVLTQTQAPTRQRVQLNLRGLERLQARQTSQYESITQSYLDGDLTQAQWYRQFVDLINSGLVASSALGVGGIGYLTRDDFQQIEQDSAIQIDYVNRFRRDIDNHSQPMALNRAKMYANATTSRYWTAHTRALGLPLLPAMPGVRTSCGSNCKCNWNIIELPGQGNWDCQWRVAAVEHCEECLRRQRTFNPLEIRNGS